jgi:hypothetical protein
MGIYIILMDLCKKLIIRLYVYKKDEKVTYTHAAADQGFEIGNYAQLIDKLKFLLVTKVICQGHNI